MSPLFLLDYPVYVVDYYSDEHFPCAVRGCRLTVVEDLPDTCNIKRLGLEAVGFQRLLRIYHQ